jgi:uncharacterized protein (TIGR03083 family)
LAGAVELSTYLEYLDADYRRLRAVAADALGEPVPSCPGWTGADLAHHVALVYVNKTECMRRGELPEPWPPDLGENPLAALEDAYRGITSEFATRAPDERAPAWYEPDQTVGFSIRRTTFETLIHRVDAELAAGLTPTPIPEELAVAGVEEVLVCYLAYGSANYPDHVGDHLENCDGSTVRIGLPGASWLVRLGPEVVTVERLPAAVPPDTAPPDTEAVVRGSADAVLRWLWRRADDAAVELDGNRDVIGKLRQLLGDTTR